MGIARARRGRCGLGGDDITRLQTHEIVRRGIGWVPEERARAAEPDRAREPAPRHDGDRRRGLEKRLEEALESSAPARAHRAAGPLPLGRRAADAGHRRGLVARPPDHAGDEPTEGLAPLLVQTST